MLCQIDTSCFLCQIAIAGLLLLPAVFASCPCQQLLPAASATAPRLAASSRWCSATAPLPAASSRWLFAAAPLPVAAMPRRSLQQHLCYGAPASNKPHPAEKSTPVWLAIWRTWAGFANSQLRCANFSALIYIYASILIAATLKPLLRHSKSVGPSAPIAYATSVSPPDEAVAWPGCRYRMAMMLLPGRGAGVGCKMRLSLAQVRRSCKSPRARILVLGTSGAHWPARWPRFELTERVDKS